HKNHSVFHKHSRVTGLLPTCAMKPQNLVTKILTVHPRDENAPVKNYPAAKGIILRYANFSNELPGSHFVLRRKKL
ncbi:hypothetical protein L9F63_020065, partial [Diploptera punctata]